MEGIGEIWKDIPSFVGVYQVSNLGTFDKEKDAREAYKTAVKQRLNLDV